MLSTLLLLALTAPTTDIQFRTQEIETTLKVGYGVVVADVNNDKKPDIVVAGRQIGNASIYWNLGRK